VGFGAPCVADAFLWSLESRYPPVDNARCVRGCHRRARWHSPLPESTIASFEWSDSANRLRKVSTFSRPARRDISCSRRQVHAAQRTFGRGDPAPDRSPQGCARRRIVVTERVVTPHPKRAPCANSPASAAGGASFWFPPPTTCARHDAFNRGELEVVPVPSDFHVVGMSSRRDQFAHALLAARRRAPHVRHAPANTGMCFYWVRGLFVSD